MSWEEREWGGGGGDKGSGMIMSRQILDSFEVELVDSRCLSPSVSISNHVVVACAPLGTYWVLPVLAVGRPWPSSSQPWSCFTSSTSCRGMVNS